MLVTNVAYISPWPDAVRVVVISESLLKRSTSWKSPKPPISWLKTKLQDLSADGYDGWGEGGRRGPGDNGKAFELDDSDVAPPFLHGMIPDEPPVP